MLQRYLALLVASLVLVGCPSDSVDPNEYHGDGTPASADRTLVLASCNTMYGTPMSLPCTTFSSGTLQTYADSGRVTLRRNFTASWMEARTMRSVPCGMSSCADTTRFVAYGEGTYLIDADTIRFTLTINGSTQQRSLIGKFPVGIDSHWPGPDSLVAFSGPPTHTTVIFKPQ